MSRTTTTNADFWSGSAPFTTLPAAGATFFAWYKSTGIGADGQFISVDSGTIDSQTWSLMVGSGGVNGQAGIYAWSSGGGVAFANAAGALPNSVWRFVAGVLSSASSRTAYNNTTAGSSGTFVTPPSGINGMHYNGINNRGIAGECAHRGVGLRGYNAVELAYLAGGGQPSNLGVEHYHQLDSSSGTESDVGSSGSPITMTVHGTTAGADDPDFATYWTAAALGAQSWTQGSAISSIDFTTKVRNVHSAYTTTLQVLAAGSQVTTANGSAVAASNLLTVNSAAAIAVGSYVSDGPTGTQALVLFKSGSTLLLSKFLTWANADPIYVYTASTKTFTGLSFTANVLGGTPAGADVGAYTLIPRYTCNANSALIADGPAFNATVAASGAAPSFSAGPTLTSANTDGYSFSATSNQTATWYLVAMLRGSTAPTQAQVKTGSPTGFVARFSTALTATVAAALSATGLTLPSYDLYQVVDNGSGTSAVVTLINQLKAPPAGKQYVPVTVTAITAITKASSAQITATAHGLTSGNWCQVYAAGGMVEINGTFLQCTVIDPNTITLPINSTTFTTYTSGGVLSWGKSRYAGGTTAPATGDVGIIDQVSSPDGIPATVFANGAMSLAVGSVTARQAVNFDLQSVSLGGLVGAGTAYFNDQAPSVANSPFSVPGIFLPANQAIPNTTLAPYFGSPQGDTLTFTGSGLAGLSISTPNLTGATGTAAIVPVSITAADNAGKQTVGGFNLVVGQVNPPNLQNLTQPTVDPQLASIYLTATYASQNDPNPAGPAPAGTVIAQNPPFGVPVNPNTVINVTLSTGIATGGGIPPVVAVVKSELIILLEAQPPPGMPVYVPGSDEISRAVLLPLGAADLSGSNYRFIRIPSNAIVRKLSILNDANPSGSSYRAGVLLPTGSGGGTPVAGADAIFFNNVSLDTSRLLPVSVLSPKPVSGAGGVVSWTQQIWELLGLTSDPQQIYDLAVTAQIPGAAGGNLVVMVDYVRGSAWLHAVNL